MKGGEIPSEKVAHVAAALRAHAEKNYPGRCREVRVEARGRHLYVDVVTTDEEGDPPLHLCRLESLGPKAEFWGFWSYSYARNRYERSMLMAGRPIGTAEECFDCAAFTHLSV